METQQYPHKTENFIRTIRSGGGIHTFEVDSPDVFLREIRKHFRNLGDKYVWRGMRNPDWNLISTFTRDIEQIPLRDHTEWKTKTSNLTLKHMVEYLTNLRGMNIIPEASIVLVDKLKSVCESCTGEFVDVLNELTMEERRYAVELFAKGQHYELHTPFLDWSYSPQVALYFAYEEKGERDPGVGSRAVYALNRTLVEKNAPPTEKWHPDKVYFIDSLALDNKRLLAQNGLFTYCPAHLSIKDWVLHHGHAQHNEPYLLKFLIKNDARQECLQDLNQMNINARTIYTESVGAALAGNRTLEEQIKQLSKK